MSKKTSVHALIVNKDGDILLTQRADVPLWVMPGGTVAPGESLEDALAREVQEEVGYELENLQQVLKTRLGSTDKYIYKARISGGSGQTDPKEVRNIMWAKINKLPSPMSLFEKNRIMKSFYSQNEVINEEAKIDKKNELLHLLMNPFAFFWFLFSYINNRLRGGKFGLDT